MTTTNIDIDDDLHAALKDKDRSMKDYVNATIREDLGLDDLSSEDAVQRRISQKEDELRDVRKEREQLEAREDSLAEEIERLEEKIEVIEANSQSITETIDGILDDMVDNPRKHVFVALPVVKRAASEHDVTAGDIMQALRDRADERELNIEEERFRKKSAAQAASQVN